MKSLLLFVGLILLVSSTVIPRVEPILTHEPKTYKVSLDDPPEVRWKQIMADFKVPLAKFMEEVDKLPIPASFYNGV
jgi:hypothetical protein